MTLSTPPLTGKALLKKVESLGNLSRSAIAKQCGYVSERDGRVNLAAFYEALLAAKGVNLEAGKDKDGRGRESTYRASVQKNGQIIIGANYTQLMGLKPGTQFEIKVGYKHIHLIQVEENAAIVPA